MKQLAFYDFDGTITTKDTLFEIAKFSTSSPIYHFKLLLLLPSFFLMKVGLLNKQKGKEWFLSMFFFGYSQESFQKLCNDFAEKRLPGLLRNGVLDSITKNIRESEMVSIVSASPENWILPWASLKKINVIATKLEFDDGIFKGKISGVNCNGKEKVKRITELHDLSKFKKIIAYGDSKGDYPMLALAHEKHYKPFR